MSDQTDYIKQLEQRNEELTQRLAGSEARLNQMYERDRFRREKGLMFELEDLVRKEGDDCFAYILSVFKYRIIDADVRQVNDFATVRTFKIQKYEQMPYSFHPNALKMPLTLPSKPI